MKKTISKTDGYIELDEYCRPVKVEQCKSIEGPFCDCGKPNRIFIGKEEIPVQHIYEFGCTCCDVTYKKNEKDLNCDESKLIENTGVIKKKIKQSTDMYLVINNVAQKALKRLKKKGDRKNVKRSSARKVNRTRKTARH